MKKYINDLKVYLNNKGYMGFACFLAIISFGYAMFNTSIGIDDLEYDRYVGSGNVMLSAGRFGMWFWGFIEGKWENSFLIDLLAVIFLIFSAINFCILFERVSNYNISTPAKVLFSGMFISYPLMNDIWEYTGANVNVCGSFLLVSFSLLLIQSHIKNGSWKRPFRLILASLFMMLVSAGYESVVLVYIFFVFAVIALQIIYGEQKDRKFLEIIKPGLIYAGILGVGIVLRVIVHRLILIICNLEPTTNGQTQILWGTAPAKEILRKLILNFITYYGIKSTIYLPLTVLVLCGILFIIMGIVLLKKRGAIMLIPGTGMLLSLIMLSLLQGKVSPYRACQVFAAFCAFTVMIFINICSKATAKLGVFLKRTAIIAIGLLCFYQATFMNSMFELNHRRSEYEAFVVRQVSVDLQRNFDKNKPVIFVGKIEVPKDITEKASVAKDSIQWKLYRKAYSVYCKIFNEKYNVTDKHRKMPQNNVNSVISWSETAFRQESMHHLFQYYGYDYVPANFSEVFNKAVSYAREHKMKQYPQNGYIVDAGEYIIVYF